MIKIIKATLIFTNILLFISILFITRCIFAFFPKKRTYLLSYIVHIFSKINVFILGIKVKLYGDRCLLKERGVLFTSNHLSYLEGFVASSLSPLVFIGRADLKKWPILGVLSLLSDTIFVKRNASDIHRELQQMVTMLNSKVNLILFPEGTSTDGTKLLPFKASFFDAPIKAKSKIIPLAVHYSHINNEKLNEQNRDLVYWYGDMEFFPHLWKVLSLRQIGLTVTICEPIFASQTQGTDSTQRKHLSNLCRKTIEDSLGLQNNS